MQGMSTDKSELRVLSRLVVLKCQPKNWENFRTIALALQFLIILYIF